MRAFPLLVLAACTPAETSLWSYCSLSPPDGGAPANPAPTYHSDVKAIVDSKCTRCHQPGGLAPFSLETYAALDLVKTGALAAVEERRMPPWLAAPCCGTYRDDFGLTEEERATFRAWVAAGAPEGDPAQPPRRPTIPAGGLARVDLRLALPAPYSPKPPAGSTDDNRCFAIDWPLDRETYISGFSVLPGNRSIVHHLIIALVTGSDAREAAERDRRDPLPGFDCNGGIGGVAVTTVIGGGLGASRLPDGFGVKVPPGAKILLNIHYSTSHTRERTPSDQTALELTLEPTGKPLRGIVVTNVAWLVGDAMRVKAGDPDAVYYYRYRPTLFTNGKRVLIHAATPHMHYFGSKFVLGILRADGTKDCLLEIPRWDFGWEQGFWLEKPKILEPDDQVYVECRFDNSLERQPIVNGQRRPPRDIAWGGNDQDMCAGFLGFAEISP